MSKKIAIVFKAAFIFTAVLFFSIYFSNTVSAFICSSDNNAACEYGSVVSEQDLNQAWRGHFWAEVQQDGVGGGAYGISACLSTNTAMWDDGDACWVLVDSNTGGQLDHNEHQNIGDIGRDIGNDPYQTFNYWLVSVYVDDADVYNINIPVDGRRVSNSIFHNVIGGSIQVGQSFILSYGSQNDFIVSYLNINGPADPSFINRDVTEQINNSLTVTGTGPGTITMYICSTGPGGNGSETVCNTTSLGVVQPAPGPFNLSSSVCYGGPDANGNGKYDLSWSASSLATSYDIYAHAWSGGSWGYIGSTSNLSFTAIQPVDTDWYFKVTARNSAGSTDSTPNNLFAGQCVSPTVSLSAIPNPVAYNAASTLTWSSTNALANSCSVKNTTTGATLVSGQPTSGSVSTGNLISSQTYMATCQGLAGIPKDSNSVTVNVSSPPTPTVDLKCSGNNSCGSVAYGEVNTLSWSILSGVATSCSVSGAWPPPPTRPISGSESTGPITSDKTWTIQCIGPGGTGPADSVSATVPPPEADIRCDNSNGPCNISWGSSSLIEWCGNNAHACADAGSCSVTKNGSSWASGTSGSQTTGAQTVPGTYTYALTCSGDGSASDSIQAIVGNPVPNNPSNITVTQPNYCVSGPAATTNWDYSDPSGSPQSAYQVQIDDQGSFHTPEWDSDKVSCSGCRSNSTPQGFLSFNTTYKARVRVWNQYDLASGWTESGSWKTPSFAFPQVNFTFAPAAPGQQQIVPNSPIQFTDQTVFYDSNPNGRGWSWLFGDGGSSTQQNPQHTYVNEGIFNTTLTATDNANQSCSITKPINVQKPNPIWKEVNPGG